MRERLPRMRWSRPAGILAAFAVCGCATSPAPGPDLGAIVWEGSSGEYVANASVVYRAATEALERRLEARPEGGRPAAIVMDVDETLLMSHRHGYRLAREGRTYTPAYFGAWAKEIEATPVPGAVDFVKAARSHGVHLFVVTNRVLDLEDATRKNLGAVGIPVTNDDLLMKGEREGWTSDKASRRDWVAERFDVLMTFGDDLNDFASVEGMTPAQRRELVEASAGKWGTEWFMLPNAMYGSWQKAVRKVVGEPKNDARAEQLYVQDPEHFGEAPPDSAGP